MKHSRLTRNAAGLLAILVAGAALPAAVMAQPSDAKPAAAANEVLAVGSKAPAIKVNKWVKGEAIDKFDPSTVYVVEFWATWCGPCKQSIPHLTELANEYKDKGVKFIGVSVWEDNVKAKSGQTYLERVDEFANKGPLSSKMLYNVAYDGEHGEMAKTWMEASNSGGIPTAFIVDKTQHIAYIGHPMNPKFAETLEKVTSGKFDMKAAQEEAKKAAEVQEKAEQIGPQWQSAMQSGNVDEAIKYADQLLDLDAEQFGQIGGYTFQMALGKDQPKAYAFANKLVGGALKDNAEGLNAIAWAIVDPSHPIEKPDVALAAKAADHAVELTKGKEPAILDTQARVYFVKGDVTKAIEIQQKVVELSTDKAKTEAEKTLAEYKAKAAK
ncbi:MAG: redoxin family protein [Tepidisphaera sp.]|nr:redoxin family protein [Tepidisphaera sp.]